MHLGKDKNFGGLESRDQWGSRWGFIIACVGSAVGMANVWAFPYRAARYGGSSYLIPYIICVVVLGCTGVVSEIAFGRWGRSGPYATFRKALTERGKPLKNIGLIPVIGSFAMATGYAIIMGWVLRYLWGSLSGAMFAAEDVGAYFGSICGDFGSFGWHMLALAMGFAMATAGISKSIERVCKVMMPLFYVMFIYMAVRVAMMPGASEGYKYLFILPDAKHLLNPETWIFALGQAFFSLSLAGNGTIVYGSYLDKKENVLFCSMNIAVFDTLAAMLAAIVVIPAVFAFGLDPASGPPLMFITLPMIFREMTGGMMFAIIFFAAILFAAATSLVNLLETPIEMIQERFGFSRPVSVGLVITAAALCGVFLENGNVIGEWMDVVSIYVCPVGAFIAAFIFYWIMGPRFAREQIGLGRGGLVPAWILPLGKYLYCGIALLVLALGIMLGGIG